VIIFALALPPKRPFVERFAKPDIAAPVTHNPHSTEICPRFPPCRICRGLYLKKIVSQQLIYPAAIKGSTGLSVCDMRLYFGIVRITVRHFLKF